MYGIFHVVSEKRRLNFFFVSVRRKKKYTCCMRCATMANTRTNNENQRVKQKQNWIETPNTYGFFACICVCVCLCIFSFHFAIVNLPVTRDSYYLICTSFLNTAIEMGIVCALESVFENFSFVSSSCLHAVSFALGRFAAAFALFSYFHFVCRSVLRTTPPIN